MEYVLSAAALYAFLAVGAKLTASRPRIRDFGTGLGTVAGGFAGLALAARSRLEDGMDWVLLLAQSAGLGAAVTAAAWIVLSVLEIASRPFRRAGSRAYGGVTD